MDPITIALIVVAVLGIIIGYIISKSKEKKANELSSKAFNAIADGDDKLAITLLKQALWKANESPDIGSPVLSKLKELFLKHNIEHDFGDYEKLIEQFRILKKKSSMRSAQEMKKVVELKKKLIDKIPELT